jgi:prepilin peptidase CpaA
LLLPLWLMRIMGAGDVKLMAMVGTFVGPAAVVLVALIVFIVGGVFALLHTARRGALRRLAANLRFIGMTLVMPGVPWRGSMEATASSSVGRLPYAVSICVGTVAFLVARQLGFV